MALSADNQTVIQGAPAARSIPPRAIGIVMVLIGATLWGISGTASQRLFQHFGFTAGWLVDTRMGVSGIVLLTIVAMQQGPKRLFAIWTRPRDAIHIVLFAIIGLYGVQYSYLTSIALGNAAMATFLQYLGPAFVLIYVTWRAKRWPTRWENVALLLACVGTLLLVTNGTFGSIVVPASSVVWGIISAITLAIYTLAPVTLIRRFKSASVIGWAMLLGAIVSCFRTPPWQTSGAHFNSQVLWLIAFVVIFGTLVAFYLYLASTTYISPSETSLIACMEPLSAAIAAVIWLHTRLGMATVIGGLCILGTVAVLSIKSGPKSPKGDSHTA